MDETLRISGSAQITDDERLLAESAVQGGARYRAVNNC